MCRAGETFPVKTAAAAGFSEGAMVDGVITAELPAGKQTHSFTVATLGPSPAQPPRHRHGSPPWRSPWPGGEQGAEPLGL